MGTHRTSQQGKTTKFALVPQVGRRVDLLEAELGDQVTAVRIDGAGHALLPEVPDQLAGAITDWLAELPE